VARTTLDDIHAAIELLARIGLTDAERDLVRRIIDAWRDAGRPRGMWIDEADLTSLRALRKTWLDGL
jgi:hypothetical protein